MLSQSQIDDYTAEDYAEMAAAMAADEVLCPLLADSQIDRLALLMGSITRMDRAGRFCNMTDNGTTLNVARHYCAHCSAVNGNPNDGEGDCIHKQALDLAWRAEVVARDEDYADLLATQAAVL